MIFQWNGGIFQWISHNISYGFQLIFPRDYDKGENRIPPSVLPPARERRNSFAEEEDEDEDLLPALSLINNQQVTNLLSLTTINVL